MDPSLDLGVIERRPFGDPEFDLRLYLEGDGLRCRTGERLGDGDRFFERGEGVRRDRYGELVGDRRRTGVTDLRFLERDLRILDEGERYLRLGENLRGEKRPLGERLL